MFEMFQNMTLVYRSTQLIAALAVLLISCADIPDNVKSVYKRNAAIEELQNRAGAQVEFEAGEAGAIRVLTMSPRFALPARMPDPAGAARDFLATHHDAFQLDAEAAGDFAVTRVDVDPSAGGNLRHVTLQRQYDGIPVFQGAITVHMDPANGVFGALGDDYYQIDTPTNRLALSPAEALNAAGRALGIRNLVPSPVSSDGIRTTFRSSHMLDNPVVEPRIFQVAPGDNRFAYQVFLSWTDDSREQHMQLALVDAQDGALLHSVNLVNTFTGLVFTRSPGVNPQTDQRVRVSFDGNPSASPMGWVGTARNTSGNNVVAATDLDANNAVGTNETQPVANANDGFDFPLNPLATAATNRSAAVTTAFYLANYFHDRTYALGFTESSGNFQLNNFGSGGAQNDPVNVDVQDGSGTNNANFATPPDGSRPRMQMFIFTINGGAQEDSDFDPTVIFHESSHGLSNRLVGGGSTGCLGGIQSGGMGEGWGDFMSATLLNDPVVGAYVTGNATIGIRRASMANSPFNYGDIRTGTTQVHQVGEIWAATLWDLRNLVGAAVVEQLVVSGMKLTPCQPTMLQARNGILQADANIFAGANRCRIFQAFAGRQMGDGASSANHNTTTGIVLSTAVPAECIGGGPVLGNQCGTDRLDDTAALQRIEWARRCALLNNTGGPSSWFISSMALDSTFVGAKEYKETDIHHAYTGNLNDYNVNYYYAYSRYQPTFQYSMFQETFGPTAGFWKWSHTIQRPRLIYPTFESQFHGGGIQLFPLPTLDSDCHLYQRNSTTGAFSRWTGNFYVTAYCEL